MSLGKILDVAAVARALGFPEASVRAMLRRGEIPGVRLRGQWRVREDDLRAKFERPGQDDRDRVIRVLQRARVRPRRLAVIAPLVAPKARSV